MKDLILFGTGVLTGAVLHVLAFRLRPSDFRGWRANRSSS